MKKNIILILLVLFIPCFVYASDKCNDVSIESVSIAEKSSETVILSEANIISDQVNFGVKFFSLDDYIEYKVLVKNNSSEKVEFSKNSFSINSEYIDYSVISKNNTIPPKSSIEVLLRVTYKNEVPRDLLLQGYDENKLLNLTLHSGDLVNPGTGFNYILLVFVLSLIIIGLYVDNKRAKSLVLLFILILPFSVMAVCNYELKFNPSVTISTRDLNPCTYDGELVRGATYENGDYIYIYGGETLDVPDIGIVDYDYGDGWAIRLKYDYPENITTKICSSINRKPITDAYELFHNVTAESIDLSTFDTSHLTNMENMFNWCRAKSLDLSNFDTSNVTSMYDMFSNSSATTLDLSSFDTRNVIEMSGMFSGSEAVSINLDSFDTSNVTEMRNMFQGSNVEFLDLSGFDTSNVIDMAWMFYMAKSKSVDLSSFDTSNVLDMSSMFMNSNFETLDLSSFNTRAVVNMSYMFSGAKATSIDLSSFNTYTVTNMTNMFYGTKMSVLDLSSFDLSNTSNTSNMFYNSLATIGYARTDEDAAILNSTSRKPSGLVFRKKE